MSSVQSGDIEGQQRSNAQTEGATWWCKILVKVCAVIAAIACGISGVFVIIMHIISPICIFAGVIMLLITASLIILELPFCCQWVKGVQGFIKMTDNFKYWQRGLYYVLISIVPVALCFSVTSFLGCLTPFATGVIYGLMSLGKKADRGEMMANAGSANMQQYSKFENEN